MTIFRHIQGEIETALRQLNSEGVLSLPDPLPSFVVEPPRDPSHGDLATNVAMLLTKAVQKPPRAIAEALKGKLEKIPAVQGVEIAGPGFINLRLAPEIWQSEIKTILQSGLAYGAGEAGKGRKINVEYVSANPTGPLTVGHTRGAVFGDVLANLLAKVGYDVTREYYINDSGKQIETLVRSVALRYREALGEDIGEIPAGCYPGEYLKEVAEAIVSQDGAKWRDDPQAPAFFRSFTLKFLMDEIKKDLGDLGVKHDLFVSEASIIESGAVEDVIRQLSDMGLIYEGILEAPKGKTPDDWEPRNQTLFKSTDFGDDIDRPLKKSDGSTTYFTNDIAHLYRVTQQGHTDLVIVLGADHGGYVKRLKSAVSAITNRKASLRTPLMSIVHVTDKGQPVRMSKRAGTFITLRDMMERVGAGVMRFIMLTRDPGQTLDFDYTKVTEQTKDNPYFYIQYTHARCCSVVRHAGDMFKGEDFSAKALASADVVQLNTPEELAMLRVLAGWPRLVEQAALAEEPHRISFYLMDLAAHFHSLWHKGNDDATLRFLLPDNLARTKARLALVKAVQTVIASGLAVMGCEAMEELRNDSTSDV